MSAAGAAEEGSATVLVAASAAVLTVVLAGVVLVTGVVADVHRARAAADLAALAAAVPLVEGGPVMCAAAGSVATGNGARLGRCGPDDDGSVRVTVTVPLRPAVRRLGWDEAAASARAGVVESSEAAGPPERRADGPPVGRGTG